MSHFTKCISVIVICLLLLAQGRSYERYQVWRMHGTDAKAVAEVTGFFGLDVWSSGENHIDILVNPNLSDQVERAFRMRTFTKQVIIEDVQSLIDQQKPKKRNIASLTANLEEYNDLSDIYAYALALEAEFAIVSTEIIGTSYEGREMLQVKVSSAPESNKKVVWLDCGIHAREWISPSTCLLFLDTIVNSYGQSESITELVDTYDFYILPVFNVDGYEYTRQVDRMWRKNRTPYGESVGVDLNRNFGGPEWGTVGASDLPITPIYHGPYPFSENETSAVRDSMESILSRTDVHAYFSIHSYGHMWLYAYGYTDVPTPSEDELFEVSSIGVAAINDTSGITYRNGPFYNILYPASGSSVDWGYDLGIVHSYLLELRDDGEYGFILPESEIVPTATEIFNGIVAAIGAIPY